MEPPFTPEMLVAAAREHSREGARTPTSAEPLSLSPDDVESLRVLLSATGPDFFRSLLTHLRGVIDGVLAYVAVPLDEQRTHVRTIAAVSAGPDHECFEYALAGTPCANVFHGGRICVYPQGVADLFPSDACLRDLQAEAYGGTPLCANDGRVIGILGVLSARRFAEPGQVEDLLRLFAVRTSAELERMEAHEKLRKSEALLRSLLDHSTSSIYVKDTQRRYVVVNREFERVSGIPMDVAVGRTPHELLPLEDAERIQAHEDEVFEKRSPVRKVGSIKLPVQGERTLVVDKAPLFLEDGTLFGTCTIATDLTEQKRLEAQLVRAQRLDSIGQLASGVAHEFNNALTLIMGFTENALNALPADHAVRSDLGEALKAGGRAARLTTQLLAFARKQVIQPRDIELPALMQELSVLLKPVIGETVRTTVRYGPELWPLHVDPGQLEQVLMNLVINARDAMPRGGTIEITAANLSLTQPRVLGTRTLPAGDYVEIRVRDEGEGVPEYVRPHLFEPFYTTKEAGKGTGLGLATCHGIVTQSGGHIEYEPQEGGGSTFVMCLPRGTGPVTPPVEPPVAEGGRGSETVLVVEDEALVRELAVRALANAGFRVLQASTGAQALEVARAHTGPLHLLLTDVVMPGMNGLELATALKRERPRVRIMLMSGYPDAALAQRGEIQREEWPLLRKPYTPRELSARVRELLDRVPV